MHFNGTFGFSKACPWEQRQAKVYCRKIMSVYRLFELNAEVIILIMFTRLMDHNLSTIIMDTPVPFFLGTGQCRTRDLGSDASCGKTYRALREDNRQWREDFLCKSAEQKPYTEIDQNM
jgi:hypothetical protein